MNPLDKKTSTIKSPIKETPSKFQEEDDAPYEVSPDDPNESRKPNPESPTYPNEIYQEDLPPETRVH